MRLFATMAHKTLLHRSAAQQPSLKGISTYLSKYMYHPAAFEHNVTDFPQYNPYVEAQTCGANSGKSLFFFVPLCCGFEDLSVLL